MEGVFSEFEAEQVTELGSNLAVVVTKDGRDLILKRKKG